jgi:hypothetical protein
MQICRIKGYAEDICRNEAKLAGLKADHANYSAIDRRNHPTLPATLSHQNGGTDS